MGQTILGKLVAEEFDLLEQFRILLMLGVQLLLQRIGAILRFRHGLFRLQSLRARRLLQLRVVLLQSFVRLLEASRRLSLLACLETKLLKDKLRHAAGRFLRLDRRLARIHVL